jgi:hypothetical protein
MFYFSAHSLSFPENIFKLLILMFLLLSKLGIGD